MRDLLLLVPTRSRVAGARRLLRSVRDHAELKTDIAFAVDDDDPDLPRYRSDIGPLLGPDDILGPGERRSLAGWTNWLADGFGGSYGHLGSFGDDMEVITPGFDRLLVEHAGRGWAWPEDGRRSGFPEAWVVSAEVTRVLGWVCLPAVRHFYVDDAVADLQRATGAGGGYCPGVRVEHWHYDRPQGGARDETYAQAEAGTEGDARGYFGWLGDRGPGGYLDCVTRVKSMLTVAP